MTTDASFNHRCGRPLWDPLGPLGPLRPWAWLVLALFACVQQGPVLVDNLYPEESQGVDFLQDWLSARCYWDGLPLYTPLQDGVERFLKVDRPTILKYNAHPPTSILLTLPFGLLSHQAGAFAWNLVSIGCFLAAVVLTAGRLGIRFSWAGVYSLVALSMICSPLRQQLVQGQFNLLLLILVVASWVLADARRWFWSGLMLGIAATIKLYPAFLLCVFVFRPRWRGLVGGLVGGIAATLLTVSILGVEAYSDYVTKVVPSVAGYRGSPLNVSVQGWWSKLFEPENAREGPHLVPLYDSSAVARFGGLLSSVVVAWIVCHTLWRTPLAPQALRFSVAIVGMSLVCPITWDHYLLLLLLPLAILWHDVGTSWLKQITLILVLTSVMATPYAAYLTRKTPVVVLPTWTTVTILSVQTYALLAILAWLWSIGVRPQESSPQS